MKKVEPASNLIICTKNGSLQRQQDSKTTKIYQASINTPTEWKVTLIPVYVILGEFALPAWPGPRVLKQRLNSGFQGETSPKEERERTSMHAHLSTSKHVLGKKDIHFNIINVGYCAW